MRTTASTPAAQLREMGVDVGEVIVGKEVYASDWHVSKLKVLFIGQTAVVFEYWSASYHEPEFKLIGEVSSWDLRHRDWVKESKND